MFSKLQSNTFYFLFNMFFRARGFALDLAVHGVVSGVFGAGFNVGLV